MSKITYDAPHADQLHENQKSGLGAQQFSSRGVQSHSIGEGPLARAIEEQTARIPSDAWLWAAGASIAASMILQAQGKRHRSLFVGNWAPTFLLLGIYNKLVKLHGSQ